MSEKQKSAPFNTAKEAAENPLVVLVDAMVLGSSESILHQEAQGQQSLVNSDTLPTNMGHYSGYDTRAILEAAGVKFLGVVEGDDMFQYVELPQGWKKVPTDHSMWSKLVDDKGRERAGIFYKAAFYDRSAHMSLLTRFGIQRDYARQDKEGVAVTHITDGGEIIYTTKPIKLPPKNDRKYYEIGDKADNDARGRLDQHYPDWRYPGAYWS